MEAETGYANSAESASPTRFMATGRSTSSWSPGFVSHVELLWEELTVARFLRRLTAFARPALFGVSEGGPMSALYTVDRHATRRTKTKHYT